MRRHPGKNSYLPVYFSFLQTHRLPQDDPDPDVSKAEDDENPQVSDSNDDENPWLFGVHDLRRNH